MRIVEVIPQLSSGGAERFVVDLCNQLEGMGHEIVLIVLSCLSKEDGTDFYISQLSEGVKIIELNKRQGIDYSLFTKLYKVIREIKPDIVHSHLRSLPYLLPSFLFNRKVNYFHTIHNDAKVEASDLFNRLSRKIAFNLNGCNPITISKESDISFQNYYGNINRRLIENGSPKAKANPQNAREIIDSKNNGNITLVNVARHNPQKNIIALVEAVSKFQNVELFLIGNNYSEYGAKVKEKSGKNVHILGQRQNPRDYIAAADAFILPSIYEGMPITLIECFSVGTIPIVTHVGGMKNMVKDFENGIIIDSPQKDDIVKALKWFLSLSNKEKERIKENSLKSFGQYDIENCARKYEKLFQS